MLRKMVRLFILVRSNILFPILWMRKTSLGRKGEKTPDVYLEYTQNIYIHCARYFQNFYHLYLMIGL